MLDLLKREAGKLDETEEAVIKHIGFQLEGMNRHCYLARIIVSENLLYYTSPDAAVYIMILLNDFIS
jgi:hypothetical protein